MIRVSATTLDCFRLFMAPDNDWMTEPMLIESITRTGAPTPAMKLGSAFGGIIEAPDRYRTAIGDYVHTGHRFAANVMAPVLAHFDRRGLFEVKGGKTYGEAFVVAVADHMIGAELGETKTTLSSFDFEKYAHSVQWRLTADIFQPARVVYRVFTLAEADPDGYLVKACDVFNLYPYPGIHEDCASLVEQFVAYAKGRGLDGALRMAQARAEAA